eukprot:2218972-Prymnesium_polylepis.1
MQHALVARRASAAPGSGACGGVNVKKIGCGTPTFFRAVAHFVPSGSQATRAVNMRCAKHGSRALPPRLRGP